jgi:hypothetical protein
MVVDNHRLPTGISYRAKIDDDFAIFGAALISALTAMPENHRGLPRSAAIR